MMEKSSTFFGQCDPNGNIIKYIHNGDPKDPRSYDYREVKT